MGHEVIDNPLQVDLLRSHLHKSLPGMVPGLCEETAAALEHYIPDRDDSKPSSDRVLVALLIADDWALAAWVPLPATDLMRAVVTRTNHRFLVGSSKCRDRDWVNLNSSYVDDVLCSIAKMNIVPNFLKP
jgi:hypothetical protein